MATISNPWLRLPSNNALSLVDGRGARGGFGRDQADEDEGGKHGEELEAGRLFQSET